MYDVSPQVLASVLLSGGTGVAAAAVSAGSSTEPGSPGDHLPGVLAATGIADGRFAWMLAAAALMLMVGLWASLRVRGMRVVAGVDTSFDAQRVLAEIMSDHSADSDS